MADAETRDDIARRQGAICEALHQIREMIPDHRQQDLERILVGLRGGGNLAALQRELHQLLRHCEVAAGLGGATRGAGIGGLPPTDGHPVVDAYICPYGHCDRVIPARNRTLSRECLLHGEPMRHSSLP